MVLHQKFQVACIDTVEIGSVVLQGILYHWHI